MKPQTMTLIRFFNELCFELDLDPDKSDEHSIIEAVTRIQTELELSRNSARTWKRAATMYRKSNSQMAQRVEDAEQGWHDEVISKYE